MWDKNKSFLIFVLAAVLALSLGVWFGLEFQTPGRADRDMEKIQGVILVPPKSLPEFTLTDNKQRPFGVKKLKNTWSILFFGYTHCPDVCPTTLQTLRKVNEKLEQMQVTPPQTIFVSVDPERDTPDILDSYMNYFNKDFIGLNGDIAELEKLAGALGVYFRKAAGASGDIEADDYAMDHTAAFIVINPQGTVAAFLSPPHEVDRIIRDLRVIVKEVGSRQSAVGS